MHSLSLTLILSMKWKWFRTDRSGFSKVDQNRRENRILLLANSKWSIPQHWKDLPLNILSIIPLLLGLSHWQKCDSIPLLPLFLICFGGVNVIRSIVSFAWKIPRDFRHMDRNVTETKVVLGLGRVLVCLAVWGAVLTLRDVSELFPDGGKHCSRAVYLPGLIVSASTLGIVLFILTLLTARYLKVNCIDTTQRHRDIRFFYESYYSSDSEEESSSENSLSSEEGERSGPPSF